jgi:hypothetical protein
MTVRDFYNMVLRDVRNLDGKVTLTVHCPYGGNSLPVEISTISFNNDQSEVYFNLSPADGVEFEVCAVQEDDYEPDFGQCGKCGDWVHFPCYTCQARAMEAKTPKRLPEATEEEALMQHIDHVAENRGDR